MNGLILIKNKFIFIWSCRIFLLSLPYQIKSNKMIKGNLKLIDRDEGIVEFCWNKYYPQTLRFQIKGDTKSLFHRWFWCGDTTACLSRGKIIPDLGRGKQITISNNGLNLTGVDNYEFLRSKNKHSKISFQIEHVFCV